MRNKIRKFARDDADDVISLAYLRAIKSEHQYDGRPIEPWLYTLAHYAYRTERKRRRASIRDERVTTSDEGFDAHAGVNLETAYDVERIIELAQRCLSPRDQALLQDGILHGIAAAAEMHNEPMGTVSRRMSEARKRLEWML